MKYIIWSLVFSGLSFFLAHKVVLDATGNAVGFLSGWYMLASILLGAGGLLLAFGFFAQED